MEMRPVRRCTVSSRPTCFARQAPLMPCRAITLLWRCTLEFQGILVILFRLRPQLAPPESCQELVCYSRWGRSRFRTLLTELPTPSLWGSNQTEPLMGAIFVALHSMSRGWAVGGGGAAPPPAAGWGNGADNRTFNLTTVRYKVGFKGGVATVGMAYNCGTNKGIQSAHVGGAHVLMADGTVRFINNTLDNSGTGGAFFNLTSKSGKEVVGEF